MREDFTFRSNDGKTDLHGVKWTPENLAEGQTKGVLQLTHGMIEYILRYDEFANFMVQNGWIVVGHDHLGHGQSAPSRGELGYICEDAPSDTLVADMHTLRTMMTEQYPGLPYFMLGHSMGSYLLRKYLATYGSGLKGAILTGTGHVEPNTGKTGLAVVKFLTKIKGSHYRSGLVTNLTFGKSYKQFDMTGKFPKNSWLTKEVEIVNHYYSDPFCTYRFTLNGYRGLIETTLFDCQQENVDKIPEELPVLIASGDRDPVGDLGEGVKKVYSMMQHAGIRDVTMKLYPGDRHEILNETDRDVVYQDILNWMLDRLS